MYSCVPDSAAGDVAVEAVAPGSARPARRRRRRARPGGRTCSWCRASPPTARAVLLLHGGRTMRRGSLVSPPARPSASASRLAGSMVTTTALRPAPRASTASDGGGGRLADPARARADDDRALGDQPSEGLGRGRHVAPAVMPPARRGWSTRRSARVSSSSAPRPAVKQNGRCTWGSGSALDRRATCSCCCAWRARRKRRGLRRPSSPSARARPASVGQGRGVEAGDAPGTARSPRPAPRLHADRRPRARRPSRPAR